MIVFRREVASYRCSTYIWILSLSAIAIVYLLMFPAFTSDIEVAKKAISTIPEVLQEAVGFSLSNFFTIYGFFGYIMSFVALAGAVQAMNLGVNIISKEESGKTADFIFTKPISRFKILTSKIVAGFWLIIATNIVFSAVSLLVSILISKTDFNAYTFLLLALTLFLIQSIFFSLGILSALIIPKIKSAISVTLPTIFAIYIIGSLGAVLGSDISRNFCPFRYFETNFIIRYNNYDVKYLIIGLVIILLSLLISYLIYFKKDMKAAA